MSLAQISSWACYHRQHHSFCAEFMRKEQLPPKSPDLNPMDYYVWGAILEVLCQLHSKTNWLTELKKSLHIISGTACYRNRSHYDWGDVQMLAVRISSIQSDCHSSEKLLTFLFQYHCLLRFGANLFPVHEYRLGDRTKKSITSKCLKVIKCRLAVKCR